VSIDREGRYQALVGWEDAEVLPNTDFSLYYSVSPEDVGVNLLSYKERDEDGFFMLLMAPNVDAEQIVDKDVILILDVSGSMEGEKMEQAREALHQVLDELNERDRFNIVSFSTGVRSFSDKPEPLSALPDARRFVDSLQPEGSTDINRALLEAIDSADEERPTIIIFMTDGLPTSGVVETPLILNNVDQAATPNLRIFPFGVGDDVDTVLLDSLAQQQRGASAYVRPGEQVDEQVSSFYAKVSTPVLADISLDIDGVQIDDTYPYPLPDLFAGTQLIVTGRYRDGGPATAILTGQINGQERTFTYDDLTFASDRQSSEDTEFIPRLWATRKVGYLLNQIRLNGENRETIDEIVNLSIRYGIITPYTSFLVEEPEMALSQEGRDMLAEEEFDRAASAPAAEVSGGEAVEKAAEQNAMADAEMAAPMPMMTATPGVGGAEPGLTTAASAVTAIADKAFVFKDGVWTDTTFDPSSMTTTQLPFPSDQFLDFLANNPDVGKYFTLGARVIVVIDGVAYETVEGETGAIPDRIQPDPSQAQTPAAAVTPEPQAVDQPQADNPVTSAPPADAGDIYTTLTASVVEGVAPLEVNLTGELVGGPDNNRDYYCVESSFNFGDGISQDAIPDCVEWQEDAEIQRRYTANYLYEEPGEYQVTFSLAGAESEPITIVVKDAADEPAEDQSAPAQPTSASTAPVDKAQAAPAAGSNNCVTGLMLLPALGILLVWQRKRR
jgi:Ca-activated chloride channel family protein